LERELGAPIHAVLTMQDLMAWLEREKMDKEVGLMKEYREQYGVKP
jgi:hypothetical protein